MCLINILKSLVKKIACKKMIFSVLNQLANICTAETKSLYTVSLKSIYIDRFF